MVRMCVYVCVCVCDSVFVCAQACMHAHHCGIGTGMWTMNKIRKSPYILKASVCSLSGLLGVHTYIRILTSLPCKIV